MTVSNQTTGNESVFDDPVGITAPPIDSLMNHVSSKYALAIFAAKRARQINSYYQQADEGVFEFIGPLVTPEAGEKPLSIALREIDAGMLHHEEG
ncbi:MULTISPECIES: DNA-directed RNA polymerase subunit omega [Corynebacterium]|uniref:DNA-directed RNA polymerase subunit omega n=1 Tax=Corynebacterium TaxID=1716 RepID=UPI00124E6B82|nr:MULTISPECIES: DNA-directed RNA polymerase subunit omega [Corynebacterium]MBV7280972.1 DNA-directed RNA polymerase subunit omega [Corynebacterium sp. TAE3-ERU30]MBV7302694.1 DNA-directed RNA polymerase subunit omega [Corynebacterium sp. TAE3-ERU2]